MRTLDVMYIFAAFPDRVHQILMMVNVHRDFELFEIVFEIEV